MTPNDPLAGPGAVLTGLRTIAAGTRDALAKATARLEAAQVDHGVREGAADADPSAANLDGLARSVTALGVAQRALGKATADASRADADVRAAEQSLEQKRVDEKNAAELVALRDAASLDRYTADAARLSYKLHDAINSAREAARAIDAMFVKANEAAAALRAKGELVPPLDAVHTVAGLLRARLDADPSRARGIVRAFDAIRWGLANGLDAALFGRLDPFLGGEVGPLTPLGEVAADREDLEAYLGVRARHEITERIAEVRRNRKAEAARKHPPAPAPKIITERPGR